MTAKLNLGVARFAPQGFNPKLLWALGLTLLLCAWAWWWPAASSNAARADAPVPLAVLPAAPVAPEVAPEPVRALTPANADPFAAPSPQQSPTQASAQRTPKTVVAAVAPVAVALPPPRPVAAPPTVFGRFKTPEGQWLVFLKDGAQVLEAKLQLTLPSGYQVTELSDTGITLSATDSGEVLRLTWPTP